MFNRITFSAEERKLIMDELCQQEEKAALVEREFCGGKLCGIGGVIFRHIFFPSFFLVVGKKFQNKGIGQKLTSMVLEKWRKPLLLTVPIDNKAAMHIYEKAGFRRIAPWRKLRGKKMVLMAKI
ncbi:MAG: GNAT family N-acetyltransferase [archaeon]|nr:GNAT family N-acetyltransferase [archaeon]